MISLRISFVVCAVLALAALSAAKPDDGETITTPGPGLSYGGIPYGSMSGNVAEFFRRQAPSGGRSAYLNGPYGNSVDYAPIEQYLR
ncbi:uncharacterized protein LOC118282438 [Spodoptera frugiperda]|uniref:Uncharacterized protein LOC118282438 n=2 Tax=Spodoptera frugiperda TaxID=7108 RepID=A0A9R0DLC6_SPOFR|nr:uncharacterized protein LOC118282438 [Spodoptera frugiperda]